MAAWTISSLPSSWIRASWAIRASEAVALPRISASCCWMSWKRASSLPNWLALQRIGARDVERGQLDAGTLPAHPGPRIAQELVGLGEVGGAGQQVGLRDADLVQHDVRVLHDPQADLVGDLRGGVAGTVRLHDEALDLLVGDVPGPDEGEVRDGAGADPALGAVDDPLAVLQPRGGCQAAGDVRAVVRLGQGEGPELGEGGEPGQPALPSAPPSRARRSCRRSARCGSPPAPRATRRRGPPRRT